MTRQPYRKQQILLRSLGLIDYDYVKQQIATLCTFPESKQLAHEMLPSFIEPKVFHDRRGFLYETYNQSLYLKLIKSKIVQVIHSHSKKNTIRGMHFQYPHLQGKLVSVLDEFVKKFS